MAVSVAEKFAHAMGELDHVDGFLKDKPERSIPGGRQIRRLVQTRYQDDRHLGTDVSQFLGQIGSLHTGIVWSVMTRSK